MLMCCLFPSNVLSLSSSVEKERKFLFFLFSCVDLRLNYDSVWLCHNKEFNARHNFGMHSWEMLDMQFTFRPCRLFGVLVFNG